MIIVGEALVDLVGEEDGRFDPRPGGAARNAAVAAARLGADVTWVGGLSTDVFGQRLRTGLGDEGVDVSCAPVVDLPTPLAVVDVDDDGQPAYAFHLAGTAALAVHDDDLACLPGDDLLHVSLGAVTLGTDGLGDALVALLASHGALTSLDPNVRPAFVADPAAEAARVADAVSLVDLVRCSDEDLELLHPGVSPADVARGWHADGGPAVVLTHGDGGATAFTAAGEVTTPAAPATVVDTVGAGDTFVAALLVALADRGVGTGADLGLLDAEAWGSVLSFATAAAAVTVGRRGADPPRRDEL